MDAATEAGAAMTTAQINGMIIGYAIPAVIGGTLAILLLRFIAKRNGRLEILKGMFKKNTQEPEASEQLIPQKRARILTWEVVAGLAIMIMLMIASELIVRYQDVLFPQM